ncbi:hypothetical protein TrST_g2134 [Triparma strigata]|uniref:NAD(P)-binding domain-containing protein n=1 Tax=Triparma strigata TaxID=1606541 RepID=A0A9W7B5H7_9STRA|nr:hypothetical protein TrST_g2134 [Triparma strigata]
MSRAEQKLEGSPMATNFNQTTNDDVNSVASVSDDLDSDEELFARSRKRRKTTRKVYKGVEEVDPTTDRKVVLVTGGAGFIGSHTADYLLSRGDSVVVIDELNSYYSVDLKRANIAHNLNKHGPENFTFVEGDICDESLIEEIFSSYKVTHVCHLAARAGVRPSIDDPQIYVHSNVRGTTNLLSAAAKHKVKNFVFASSSSVYGGSKSTFFSEEEVVDNPVSPYAATKKACELLAHTYSHLYSLPCTGLRFFTVYGERGRPDMAPFKFVDRISKGEEMLQFGDGSSSRDYTYISDIVEGTVRAIDRPYKYQVFNLGKGSGTTLKDFISIVEDFVGKKAVKKILPDQPGDVPRTCASTEKARVLLGYEAKVSFREGMRRTVMDYNRRNGLKDSQAVLQGEGEGESKGMKKMVKIVSTAELGLCV